MEFRVDERAFEHIRRSGLERSLSIDIEAGADAIEAVAGLRLFDGQTDTTEVMVTVLREILSWSKGRYLWQRDALRRLVVGGELSDEDIQTLAEFCKAAHGLAEPQEVVPFDQEHVPDGGEAGASVSLDSIFHHRGVNALAEDQTLRFSPRLTVVYGDNAAGKTGYIRILKSACRARGQEQILGNVVSGAAPPAPVVAIKYRVGPKPEAREWAGQGDDEFISRVSVFDTRSAGVYLTEKTDVAFRPFGLDLFDKLVRACKAIRIQLEKEQRSLVSSSLTHLQAQVPEGTAVANLLANINVLTKPETVRELSRLSPENESRLRFLEKSLLDLKANDPEKLRRELNLRAGRVERLAGAPPHGRDLAVAGVRRSHVCSPGERSPEEQRSNEAPGRCVSGGALARDRFWVLVFALGVGAHVFPGTGLSR